jgi:hypothetical protein
MIAYVIGMITGAVCMIAPLFYMAHVNECAADIISKRPEHLGLFVAYPPGQVVYTVVVVGALMSLISTAMAAYTGVRRVTAHPSDQTTAPPGPTPEQPLDADR